MARSGVPSHVTAGLRQAATSLGLLALVGLGLALGARQVVGGELLPRYGLVLMLLAAAVAMSSGSGISRFATMDARAFLGQGMEREDRDSGRSLTAVGVLLLVAGPLFVAGALLVG